MALRNNFVCYEISKKIGNSGSRNSAAWQVIPIPTSFQPKRLTRGNFQPLHRIWRMLLIASTATWPSIQSRCYWLIIWAMALLHVQCSCLGNKRQKNCFLEGEWKCWALYLSHSRKRAQLPAPPRISNNGFQERKWRNHIALYMLRYAFKKKNDIIWEIFPTWGGGSSQIPKLL